MKHLDPDLLSLLALGEQVGTDDDVAHLAECPQCSAELAELQRTVRAARVDPAGAELARPGAHNWTAIHKALGLSPALSADPLNDAASGVGPAGAPAESTGAGAGAPAESTGATPLRPRAVSRTRGRPGRWIATAAAAGIVLGAAGAWVAAGIVGRPVAGPAPTASVTASTPSPVIVAEAPLAPLPKYSASGEAQVEKLADGTRRLVVRLSNDKVAGFKEVWVISSDLSKLVSLGVLDDEPGVFAIPNGLDLSQYPIVDVSNEPYDGNPAHSSDSIARGKLTVQS